MSRHPDRPAATASSRPTMTELRWSNPGRTFVSMSPSRFPPFPGVLLHRDLRRERWLVSIGLQRQPTESRLGQIHRAGEADHHAGDGAGPLQRQPRISPTCAPRCSTTSTRNTSATARARGALKRERSWFWWMCCATTMIPVHVIALNIPAVSGGAIITRQGVQGERDRPSLLIQSRIQRRRRAGGADQSASPSRSDRSLQTFLPMSAQRRARPRIPL